MMYLGQDSRELLRGFVVQSVCRTRVVGQFSGVVEARITYKCMIILPKPYHRPP